MAKVLPFSIPAANPHAWLREAICEGAEYMTQQVRDGVEAGHFKVLLWSIAIFITLNSGILMFIVAQIGTVAAAQHGSDVKIAALEATQVSTKDAISLWEAISDLKTTVLLLKQSSDDQGGRVKDLEKHK